MRVRLTNVLMLCVVTASANQFGVTFVLAEDRPPVPYFASDVEKATRAAPMTTAAPGRASSVTPVAGRATLGRTPLSPDRLRPNPTVPPNRAPGIRPHSLVTPNTPQNRLGGKRDPVDDVNFKFRREFRDNAFRGFRSFDKDPVSAPGAGTAPGAPDAPGANLKEE